MKSNAELCVVSINYLEKAKTIVCLSFEVLLSVPDISFFPVYQKSSMFLLRQAWITGEVRMTMGVECVLQGTRTNPLLQWFSLSETLYNCLSVSHSQ